MAVNPFAPFVPEAANPFDARKAAHLLRRAGFGATPAQIDAAVSKGLDATVEELFEESPEQEQQYQQVFDAVNGRLMNFGQAGDCQAWWVHRMVTTRTPLREKLTLFWHSHFSTSIAKIEDTQLALQQIDTLRQHAWGNFAELVTAIAKDPAMLVYLDGQDNTKEHPNENFARELMELFTVGIGNYTEADVQNAARAFTGWHRENASFKFVADAHDGGAKTFMGRRGRFDGTDIIEILMSSDATPRFIARKLLRFFACPNPTDEAVAEAAEVFSKHRLNVKWFVRDLLLSKYFYSEACYRQRISSPAEFVVGSVRVLNSRIPAGELVNAMNGMGQELLAPPNVKGWDGEKKWINSTSLASRATFAKTLSELQAQYSPYASNTPLDKIVPTDQKSPPEVVARLNGLLFQDELPAATRNEMADLLVRNEEGPQPDAFKDDENFRTARTRNLLGLMLALPEYQAY
jgi:uncharacterized protein (DUF1800 family)